MTDLRPFHSIDPYGDEPLDEVMVEAAELLQKIDWEGGLSGMIGWGGADAFPEPLRPLATAFQDSKKALEAGVREWAAERGVSW